MQRDPQLVHAVAGPIERGAAGSELGDAGVGAAPEVLVEPPSMEQLGERGLRGEMEHRVNVDPPHQRRQNV